MAVLFVAIIASEVGKMVSKETKIDILVTPLVTISVGIFLSAILAPTLGKTAMKLGTVIMWATSLQPFLMGYTGFTTCRCSTYTSYIIGSHMCGSWTHRTCRQCRFGRLLRSDGRICNYLISRE